MSKKVDGKEKTDSTDVDMMDAILSEEEINDAKIDKFIMKMFFSDVREGEGMSNYKPDDLNKVGGYLRAIEHFLKHLVSIAKHDDVVRVYRLTLHLYSAYKSIDKDKEIWRDKVLNTSFGINDIQDIHYRVLNFLNQFSIHLGTGVFLDIFDQYLKKRYELNSKLHDALVEELKKVESKGLFVHPKQDVEESRNVLKQWSLLRDAFEASRKSKSKETVVLDGIKILLQALDE